MVKVREDLPLVEGGDIDVSAWMQRLSQYTPLPDASRLPAACALSREVAEATDKEQRPGRLPMASFYTGLEMAEILAELQLDEDALVAAVLYRAVRESRLQLDDVRQRFGSEVATLIDGVTKMAAISVAAVPREDTVLGQTESQSDTIRKMLVAIVDDVRVALIKLAERTCAIRAVKDRPGKRYGVAREIADIYAPLAHRLGIGHIKWELEDLSFRYLQPQIYKKIAKLLDEKRLAREHYIERVIQLLQSELKKAGIEARIFGRAKHIYSIWRKMQRKGIGFSQIYDIRALRVLVPTSRDCYTALGIIHGMWRNIPNEFDDYIANPKENGYRSLHTAVLALDGKVLEAQIRTPEMDEEAEFGVCAHWAYKGTDRSAKTSSYDKKLEWLRQVIDLEHGEHDPASLFQELEDAQERVYVFTRDGDVVNMARDSTTLDFAYQIHTEVGHRCRGAKINGRIAALNTVLKTGDRVEILTGENGVPKRDWLQPSLGYLRSAKARACVQQWFRHQAREDNVAAGRSLVEKELQRLALNSIDYKRVADICRCETVDELYGAVGAGEISLDQVIRAAHEVAGLVRPKLSPKARQSGPNLGVEITVSGVGNLLSHFAGCCKPGPGDPIAGCLTVGRGVSVHRQDCKKLLHMQFVEPERIIAVDWKRRSREAYRLTIEVTAFDRQGLLRDITGALASFESNVVSMNTETSESENSAIFRITLDLVSLDELSPLLAALRAVPNISGAHRYVED